MDTPVNVSTNNVVVGAGVNSRVIEKKDVALQDACRQMEGLFVSTMFKEGLKAEMSEEESDVGNSGALLEMAIEQVALS